MEIFILKLMIDIGQKAADMFHSHSAGEFTATADSGYGLPREMDDEAAIDISNRKTTLQ